MEEYMKNAALYKRIWNAYQIYATTAAVRRKGYELTGMTQETDDIVPDVVESFRLRGESDLEHQAKVAWLTSVFIKIFWPQIGADVWTILVVALCHDVGEIEVGDIPHDGNPLHDGKNQAERRVFEKMVNEGFITPFERRCKDDLMKMFDDFQNQDNVGKAIFALDKLEAALMQLMCEKHGCCGDLKFKENPTDQDRYFSELTGSEKTSDIWAAHMCSLIRDFPHWIKVPVLELLDAAVRDVRGVSFEWRNKI